MAWQLESPHTSPMAARESARPSFTTASKVADLVISPVALPVPPRLPRWEGVYQTRRRGAVEGAGEPVRQSRVAFRARPHCSMPALAFAPLAVARPDRGTSEAAETRRGGSIYRGPRKDSGSPNGSIGATAERTSVGCVLEAVRTKTGEPAGASVGSTPGALSSRSRQAGGQQWREAGTR
jgi:hypothetical protein